MWRCHTNLLVVCVVLLGPFVHDTCSARSAEMKTACSNCHTIHNMEDTSAKVGGGPLEGLMNATCADCHTGTNGAKDMPFVTDIAEPAYNPAPGTRATLAGGNFYWVAGGADLKGHNVVGVGANQVLGRNPPGSLLSFDELTCAGKTGCHGDLSIVSQVKSLWGSHHGNTTGIAVGGPTATSYRFLQGIAGVEDNDWEYSLGADDHNQYKGDARGADLDIDTSTISHLCANCHGYFHSGANPDGVSNASFASPWIRHPVDFDMGPFAGPGSEYAAYGDVAAGGDGAAGTYNVRTPLADNIATGVLNTVTLGSAGGDAIITCITCHRAHGSFYEYSLRWDYKGWPGGANDGGCYNCHTLKN